VEEGVLLATKIIMIMWGAAFVVAVLFVAIQIPGALLLIFFGPREAPEKPKRKLKNDEILEQLAETRVDGPTL
jgi:hypothetical protein